uniref:Uncharacterized protein n=1 Tax=Rhizophora mucronata TaxID=61149 RepID=A0A2P2PBB6_RHIMU
MNRCHANLMLQIRNFQLTSII